MPPNTDSSQETEATSPPHRDESVEWEASSNSFVWNDEQASGASGEADNASETGARDTTRDAQTPEWPEASRQTMSPERYLLGGESLVDSFETGVGWVAITTHRLLVFDPDGDGRRFEAIDRLNVLGVRTTGGGDPERLSTVVRASLYAAVLLGAGFVGRGLGLGSLFSTTADTAATPGLGGLVSALSLVGALFSLLISLLFVAGALVGVVAVGLGLLYFRGRHPTLIVERAGEAHLRLTVSSSFVGERVVSGVERALADELALVDTDE